MISCPPPLRDACKTSAGDIAAETVLAALRDGYPVARILTHIRQTQLEDTLRIYGASHPEARS
ncbi:hypothetical protein MASR1M32_10420 [Rhodobacter sp.]